MNFSNMTPEEKKTIVEHFEELRKSLIISIVAIVAAAVLCFSYNEKILAVITLPLRILDQQLIVTGVTEAFFVKLILSFYAGFVLAFPIVVWAVWRFFKPALYPSERKYVYVLLPVSVLLFSSGVLFSYFGILPLVLNFFIYIAGENLETMFKVDQYVSFVTAFTIPFGLVFELPVVVYFLTKFGVIRPETLSRNRKYALLIIVILAAALTPGPDPISQMMMAGPVYLLYEISIIVSKMVKPGKGRDHEGEEEVT
ncbi:MAG: twin-arginine translocase subunit TatC [Syntrophomonadaceae bacterium]|nr:twin-arginine translocase subunit TatC [Syntrophomonadaceae bacterium]MDD3023473.1 twin-arginine translocase subunit TatC [Syntrophomonadaceae bacterium]